MIHHREQLEQDAKEIIANIKNLSPTLLAGAVGGGLGPVDMNDDRLQAALHHIDNLARELRTEVHAHSSKSNKQIAHLEANFTGDLKRLGGILSDCVSQIKGIQVELSKFTLSKFEPRLANLEAKMGLPEDEESTDTGKSRSPTEASSEGVGMKFLNTLSKVLPGSVPREKEPKPKQLRQGLKDRLHGIHSSIYQVLGALESFVEEEATAASNDGSSGSVPVAVALPFRPEGTLEKQLQREKAMQAEKARLRTLSEQQRSSENLRELAPRDFPAASPRMPRAVNGANSPLVDRPRNLGHERSPSPSGLSLSGAQLHAQSNLQSLVNTAVGPRVISGTGAYTAPPSAGVSRDLSPTRHTGPAPCAHAPCTGRQSPNLNGAPGGPAGPFRPPPKEAFERTSQGIPRNSNGGVSSQGGGASVRPQSAIGAAGPRSSYSMQFSPKGGAPSSTRPAGGAWSTPQMGLTRSPPAHPPAAGRQSVSSTRRAL